MYDVSALHRLIVDKIDRQGPITFAEFMELCLYHPEHGYYAAGWYLRKKRADYYTCPGLHPVFGTLIAKQLVQMWRLLESDRFEIVELGGGEGHLAFDILTFLKERVPDCYDVLTYHMVEVGAPLIARQRELLKPFDKVIRWLRPDDFTAAETVGCIVSNELVDALPVHRVKKEEGQLKEIFVTADANGLAEVVGSPSDPALEAYFRRLGIDLQEGQQAEVNLRALSWIRQVADRLGRGFVVTIDYGHTADVLYAPARRDGTLVCYWQHRVSSDPYIRIGRQDMTAHVDFTSLILNGRDCGLELTGLVPQYKFLLSLGFLDEMMRWEKGVDEIDAVTGRLAMKQLILPDGMGGPFKVLIQHKGLSEPTLDGLNEAETEVNYE
jgi:SAM-dependent MidA family methyltransferase